MRCKNIKIEEKIKNKIELKENFVLYIKYK